MLWKRGEVRRDSDRIIFEVKSGTRGVIVWKFLPQFVARFFMELYGFQEVTRATSLNIIYRFNLAAGCKCITFIAF